MYAVGDIKLKSSEKKIQTVGEVEIGKDDRKQREDHKDNDIGNLFQKRGDDPVDQHDRSEAGQHAEHDNVARNESRCEERKRFSKQIEGRAAFEDVF